MPAVVFLRKRGGNAAALPVKASPRTDKRAAPQLVVGSIVIVAIDHFAKAISGRIGSLEKGIHLLPTIHTVNDGRVFALRVVGHRSAQVIRVTEAIPNQLDIVDDGQAEDLPKIFPCILRVFTCYMRVLIIEPTGDILASCRHDLQGLIQVQIKERVDDILKAIDGREEFRHRFMGKKPGERRVKMDHFLDPQLCDIPFKVPGGRRGIDFARNLLQGVEHEQGCVGACGSHQHIRACPDLQATDRQP